MVHMSHDEQSPVPPEEYGLAELAEISGVSERTIRDHQNERLLPKPAKKGRDAVDNAEHRERLAVITELRDRGSPCTASVTWSRTSSRRDRVRAARDRRDTNRRGPMTARPPSRTTNWWTSLRPMATSRRA